MPPDHNPSPPNYSRLYVVLRGGDLCGADGSEQATGSWPSVLGCGGNRHSGYPGGSPFSLSHPPFNAHKALGCLANTRKPTALSSPFPHCDHTLYPVYPDSAECVFASMCVCVWGWWCVKMRQPGRPQGAPCQHWPFPWHDDTCLAWGRRVGKSFEVSHPDLVLSLQKGRMGQGGQELFHSLSR